MGGQASPCPIGELIHSPIGAMAQNFVGLTKLAVLPLKSLHLLGDITRQTCSFAAIDLGLFDPSCRVAGEQPILEAIDETAAQRNECSAWWSYSIRIARLRTSGENLFVVLRMMAPLSQKSEPEANPARFKRYILQVSVRSGPCVNGYLISN